MINCPTKLIHPEAKVPSRGSKLAAGYDICCVAGLDGMSEEALENAARIFGSAIVDYWDVFKMAGMVTLQPQRSFVFRTGFAQAIPDDYCCKLWDRSGMGGAKKVARLAGLIDPDYRGEWYVCLVNHSLVPVEIRPGDKIVQGIYQLRTEATFPLVTELPTTDRGEAGFGSTGS